MKQFLPMNPTKRGFKVWFRADISVPAGVCYTGKQESTVEVGLGRNVVTRLTWDLEGQHYTVYMDNIFRGLHATGAMIADSAIWL